MKRDNRTVEYYEMYNRDNNMNAKRKYKNKIINENHLFTNDQKSDMKKMVENEYNKYKDRLKYMNRLDNQAVLSFTRSLLSIGKVEEIDTMVNIEQVVNTTIDRLHTLDNIDSILTVLEVVHKHNIRISEESRYAIISTCNTLCVGLDMRVLVYILNMIPIDRYSEYVDIYVHYADIFMRHYGTDTESLKVHEYIYMIDILRIYRSRGYNNTSLIDDIEDIIYDNLYKIDTSILYRYMIYILNSIDISFDRRVKILDRLDSDMIGRMRYMRCNDCVDILYQLIKHNIGSNLLYNLLIDTIQSNILDMDHKKIKTLIHMVPILMGKYDTKMVSSSILRYIVDMKHKIDIDVVYDCYIVYSMNGIDIDECKDYMIDHMNRYIHIVSIEQVSSILYISLNIRYVDSIYTNIMNRLCSVDMCGDKVYTIDMKYMSYIVYIVYTCDDKSKVQYIYDAYDRYICHIDTLSIKHISYILWSVTMRYDVKQQTLRKMMIDMRYRLLSIYSILDDDIYDVSIFDRYDDTCDNHEYMDDVSSWDIMNIVSNASKYKDDSVNDIVVLISPIILYRLDTFTPIELFNIYRVYCEHDYYKDNRHIHTILYDRIIHQLVSLSVHLSTDIIHIIMYYIIHTSHINHHHHHLISLYNHINNNS